MKMTRINPFVNFCIYIIPFNDGDSAMWFFASVFSQHWHTFGRWRYGVSPAALAPCLGWFRCVHSEVLLYSISQEGGCLDVRFVSFRCVCNAYLGVLWTSRCAPWRWVVIDPIVHCRVVLQLAVSQNVSTVSRFVCLGICRAIGERPSTSSQFHDISWSRVQLS